ncbi:hypothetical protein ABZV80_32385 [Streptomyces sp. NPDC005132]|uniref:hypothetical protein n=1 Tax=Streptomyces sp. NPDC005132 TaxID=3154294 RepID=UPI0033A9D8DA
MTSNHQPAPRTRAAGLDNADIEEVLRAEARAVEDMLRTHDTDDFMRRLAHRITNQATSAPRVRRAATDETGWRIDTVPVHPPAQPPNALRHDPVRPRSRRARRRGPTPITGRSPQSDPRATRAYLLDVCETVLCDTDDTRFDLYDCDGARTFACMLYLLGRRASAVFWWGFAAGAEDPLAAHLLATHYAIDDTSVKQARVWRWHARLLGYRSRLHLPHLIQDNERPKEQLAADLASLYPWPQITRAFLDAPPV